MGKNIVVTIPADKLAEVEAEEAEVERRLAAGETEILYYWQLGRLPKDEPDRIYFVWNGSVRAFHVVIGMRRDEGRVYMSTAIHELPKPIPMRGFQGFRYFNG
jgi:hypothetical protein